MARMHDFVAVRDVRQQHLINDQQLCRYVMQWVTAPAPALLRDFSCGMIIVA